MTTIFAWKTPGTLSWHKWFSGLSSVSCQSWVLVSFDEGSEGVPNPADVSLLVVQGRPLADIVKILQLTKKLAQSDTKGVMAVRLLELLWSISLYAGPEASAHALESHALADILGQYASVNCANKEIFMDRCLQMVTQGTASGFRTCLAMHPGGPFTSQPLGVQSNACSEGSPQGQASWSLPLY